MHIKNLYILYVCRAKIFRVDPNTGKKNMFNKLSKEQALKLLNKEGFSRKTISFYRYVILKNPEKFNMLQYNMFITQLDRYKTKHHDRRKETHHGDTYIIAIKK